MNLRLAGRIVASLLFIATLGIVAFALYRNAGAPNGTRSTGGVDARGSDDSLAIDDLSATMEPVPLTSLSVEGGRGVVSVPDPDTGEIEVMVTYESLDPLPNGLMVLAKPMAWIFKGSSVILVEAAEGQVHWPSQDREPESGTLRGGVTISVFSDARDRFVNDNTTRQQMGEPAVQGITASANFNAVLMELRTLDPISVTGPGLTAEVTGLSVRVSELDRTLKLLRINDFHTVTYDPRAARVWQRAQREQTQTREEETPLVAQIDTPETEGAPGSDSARASDPRVDLYHARFAGKVHMSDSVRSLEAEQIDLWARFVDGSLRDGAIGSMERETPSEQRGNNDAAPRERSAPADNEDSVITFSGSGPLEIRPLREAPVQLAEDDVYLQIQSPKSNAVVAHDGQSGASLRCVTLEYGATTRRFTTLGLAGTGVTAQLPGVFEAVVGRFDQDLTSGEGIFPGPGVITLATDGDTKDDVFGTTEATIRWQDGCAFSIDTQDGPVGSSGALVPLSVRLSGRVEAEYGGHHLRGNEATITLERSIDPVTGEIGAVIRSIRVSDGARLVSDGHGRIAGDEMVLLFDHAHPGAEPRLTRATASGGVLADDARGRVQAEFLEALFDDDSQPIMLIARDGATVSSPEGYIASGDEITVDLVDRGAVITGNASLGQNTDTYLQSLRGERITLDEASQIVEMHGPGVAEYSTPKRKDTTHNLLQIESSDGMRFNNLSGQADFIGTALITAEREHAEGGIERVIAKGSRLTVHLTPYTPEGARRLLRVEIEERASENEPAELDLRRFAVAPGEQLVGLLNLRGPRIVYDAQVHRLIVPEAGTLLVDDRRPVPERDNGSEDFPDIRGSTGFWWDQSLTLDLHDTGHEARMHGRVRMVHQPRAESERLELECERLAARISPGGSSGDLGEHTLTLEEVRAQDAVFVRHGGVELVADSLLFDGATQRVTAAAASGNRITVLDTVRRNHYVAEEISMDILSGRWTITRGAAIAMPGGGG